MVNPIEILMRCAGVDYEISREGTLLATTKGLPQSAEKYVGFFPGTDVQVGDELQNTVTKQTHTVTEIDYQMPSGKVASVKAIYATKRQPQKAGHTINIGSAIGSPIMMDSPGASQSVTFTGNQAADLRKVLGQLLQDVDGLEIESEAKAELRQDAEYLHKTLEAGKAKPSFVRECLDRIKTQLATAASKVAASGVASKVSKYAQMVQDFYTAHFGNV